MRTDGALFHVSVPRPVTSCCNRIPRVDQVMGDQDNMGYQTLKTGHSFVDQPVVRPVILSETSEVPRITFPSGEGVVQIRRVDNKYPALPASFSDPSSVDIKNVIPNVPGPTSPTTNQDRLGERGLEDFNEGVQVDKEFIGQVILHPVSVVEEVIK